MRIAKMIASGVLGGGAAPVQYLLRDQFTTDDDAPMTSPRTCEPGPGKLVITDAANCLSVSGGKMIRATGNFKVVGQTNAGGGFARAAGLAFYVRNTCTVIYSGRVSTFVSSGNGSAIADGASVSGGYPAYVYDNNAAASIGFPYAFKCRHEFLIINRSAGAFVLSRGGGFGPKWRLLYPARFSTDATLYPVYLRDPNGVNDAGVTDDFVVHQMSGAFSSDYGIATYYDATPSSDDACTASKDSIVEFTWTPAEGETLDIYIRQTDAQNRNIIRCSQAGSTIASFKVVANTETQVQSVAQTWTAGTPYRIVVYTDTPKVSVDVAGSIAYKLATAASANLTGTGYGVSGFSTGANFAVYPIFPDVPNPFGFTGFRWFAGIGDSKTADQRMPGYVSDKMEDATGVRWSGNREPMAVSGYSVSTVKDNIAAWLAAQIDTPEYVLINLGTNDAASAQDETAWKANYRVIISAVHAKWPAAQIYLAKPVRLAGAPPSTPVAVVATLHGYIDDLIAEQTYLHTGIDETSLEGGDGYVTYFGDFAHPNEAGYEQCGVLWEAILHP